MDREAKDGQCSSKEGIIVDHHETQGVIATPTLGSLDTIQCDSPSRRRNDQDAEIMARFQQRSPFTVYLSVTHSEYPH